jgi:hypothetical protein
MLAKIFFIVWATFVFLGIAFGFADSMNLRVWFRGKRIDIAQHIIKPWAIAAGLFASLTSYVWVIQLIRYWDF